MISWTVLKIVAQEYFNDDLRLTLTFFLMASLNLLLGIYMQEFMEPREEFVQKGSNIVR